MLRPLLSLCALTGALLTVAATARADDPPAAKPLRWDLEWTHAGLADYALTGVGLGSLALELALLQPKQPPLHWTGPILFDQAVRDVLRGSTVEVRHTAASVSWGLLDVNMGYSLVVDVPYAWARYGPDVARDLFWQDSTALSLAGAADLALRDAVGRARPSVSDCLGAGGSTSQCLGDSTESTRSFPGGHMALATTGAVLVCTQHMALHLYGAPWDAIACAAALTADVGVGVLRIVTDNHWATDVIAGSALGFAFGWGVPVVMHLRPHSGSSTAPGPMVAPFPIVVEHGAGLGVTGLF
jgi:membrane-associated phospholipid phosphatase